MAAKNVLNQGIRPSAFPAPLPVPERNNIGTVQDRAMAKIIAGTASILAIMLLNHLGIASSFPGSAAAAKVSGAVIIDKSIWKRIIKPLIPAIIVITNVPMVITVATIKLATPTPNTLTMMKNSTGRRDKLLNDSITIEPTIPSAAKFNGRIKETIRAPIG